MESILNFGVDNFFSDYGLFNDTVTCLVPSGIKKMLNRAGRYIYLLFFLYVFFIRLHFFSLSLSLSFYHLLIFSPESDKRFPFDFFLGDDENK